MDASGTGEYVELEHEAANVDVLEVEKLENSELAVELEAVTVASEDEAADNEVYAKVVGIEAEKC